MLDSFSPALSSKVNNVPARTKRSNASKGHRSKYAGNFGIFRPGPFVSSCYYKFESLVSKLWWQIEEQSFGMSGSTTCINKVAVATSHGPSVNHQHFVCISNGMLQVQHSKLGSSVPCATHFENVVVAALTRNLSIKLKTWTKGTKKGESDARQLLECSLWCHCRGRKHHIRSYTTDKFNTFTVWRALPRAVSALKYYVSRCYSFCKSMMRIN